MENHVKDLVSVDFFTVPTPAQAIGLEEAGPDRLRPPIPAAPAKPFRDVNEEPSAEEGCSGTTESCIP